MLSAHEIKSPFIRMPVYVIAMPVVIFLLLVIFLLQGVQGSIVGLVNGFIDGARDGNRMLDKSFWINCWRGFMGN